MVSQLMLAGPTSRGANRTAANGRSINDNIRDAAADMPRQQDASDSRMSGNSMAAVTDAIRQTGSQQLGVLNTIAQHTSTIASNTTQANSHLAAIVAALRGSGGGASSFAGGQARGPGPTGRRAAASAAWDAAMGGASSSVANASQSQLRIAQQQMLRLTYDPVASPTMHMSGRGGMYGPPGSAAPSARWAAAQAKLNAYYSGQSSPSWQTVGVGGPPPMTAGGGGLGGGGGGYTGGGGSGGGGGSPPSANPAPAGRPARPGRRGNPRLYRGAMMAARYAGLGEAVGIGEMALGAMSNPFALGAVAAGAALVAPEVLHGAANFIFDKTSVARDYRRGMASLGRAGGFANADLQTLFAPSGRGSYADWMGATGTGAVDAVNNLNAYGLPGVSASATARTAASLAGIPFQDGLSGMDPSAIIAHARMRDALGVGGSIPDSNVIGVGGIGGSSRVGDTLGKLNQTLSRAVTEGLDRATVLQSIDQNIQTQTRVGGSADGNRSEDYVSRMMNGGLSGARSGQFAADFQSGMTNFFANPNANSTSSYANYAMINKYSAPGALEGLLGKDQYGKLMSDPAGRQTVADFYSLAKISPALAQGAFTQIMQSADADTRATALDSVLSPITGGRGTAVGRAAFNGLGGVGYFSAAQQQLGTLGSDNPRSRLGTPRMDRPYISGSGTWTDTPEARAEAAKRLKAMGVSSEHAQMLINTGAKWNINPSIIGAHLMVESNDGASLGRPGDNGGGAGQFLRSTWREVDRGRGGNINDITTNIDYMGQYLNSLRGKYGSIGAADAHYGDGTDDYRMKFMGYMNRSGDTVDNTIADQLDAEAKNKAAGLGSPEDAWGKLESVANLMNTASAQFANNTLIFGQTVREFGSFIGRMTGSLPVGHGAYPKNHNLPPPTMN